MFKYCKTHRNLIVAIVRSKTCSLVSMATLGHGGDNLLKAKSAPKTYIG